MWTLQLTFYTKTYVKSMLSLLYIYEKSSLHEELFYPQPNIAFFKHHFNST